MNNKIIYEIVTPYRDYYQLSKKGYVIKYSNGLDKSKATKEDLKTWQVIGIRKILPFGNLGYLIPLNEAIKIDNFCFKNGNPKYTIEDIDHNTHRITGNTKYHGVKNLYKV
jgi:hypothetical protein